MGTVCILRKNTDSHQHWDSPTEYFFDNAAGSTRTNHLLQKVTSVTHVHAPEAPLHDNHGTKLLCLLLSKLRSPNSLFCAKKQKPSPNSELSPPLLCSTCYRQGNRRSPLAPP